MRRLMDGYWFNGSTLSLLAFALASFTTPAFAANVIQECMVQAKVFQNPSAMAGAAETCMRAHFGVLEAEATRCREEATAKTFPGSAAAACQASLIFELSGQVDDCEDEAKGLLQPVNEWTEPLEQGASAGCGRLREQATTICRDNAAKFTGFAQSAAVTACETAGF